MYLYSVYLLLHLIHGHVNEARLLWQRVPDSFKSRSVELAGIWDFVKALAVRDNARLWQLSQLCSEWSAPLQPVLLAFWSAHRQNVLRDLSRSFDIIPYESMKTQCGMTDSDLRTGLSFIFLNYGDILF